MENISEVLSYINKMTGFNLTLCDYFTGVKNHRGQKYFNVVVHKPVHESEEYTALIRLSTRYGDIQVEPNGYKRLAIYF